MTALALPAPALTGKAARYSQERIQVVEKALQDLVASMRFRLAILRLLQFLPMLLFLLPTAGFRYIDILVVASFASLVIYIARISTAPESLVMAESLLAEVQTFRRELESRAHREETPGSLPSEQFERFEDLASRVSRRFPGLIGRNAGRVVSGEPKARS